MNILIIGDSPYLITRNARIVRDIATYFSNGNKVDILAFNHDTMYFLPNKQGESFFNNMPIHVFNAEGGAESLLTYQTMKKTQPHVVITVGHYAETDFIHRIKMLYPHLFKWISIVTSATTSINERYKNNLDYADVIIALNSSSYSGLQSLLAVTVKHIPYGTDDAFFDLEHDRIGAIYATKNAQISNVPAFIACSDIMPISLHYNADDSGFYDVPLLIRRSKANISLPSKFVSVRDGIKDDELNEVYNAHAFVVDCSMQPTTAISVLEAMATGCIPVGPRVGALKDILDSIPENIRLEVEFEPYIGELSELFAIISVKSLKKTMIKAQEIANNKEMMQESRYTVKCVSQKFSKGKFLEHLNQIVQDIMLSRHAIIVDSLV